jgi:ABC-type uncharacterized transport system permease subunit
MLFDLHLAALVLYGVSAAITLAPFAGLPAVSRRWTLGVASLGAILHGIGVYELIVMGITGLARPLSVLAWFLVVLQIGSELLLRVGTVALFTAPLAGGLVGLALILGLAPGAQPSAGGNAWFMLHVALSVLGLALLALAFISAALYVLQFRELKAKRFGQVFLLFPPLERLDRLNLVALVAGFPALTIGVLLAVGYALRAGMHVDPAQLVWGSFTWVVLGWTVWVRVARHWAGRRAAFASIAGFAAVVLVYIALKLVQPGTQRFL